MRNPWNYRRPVDDTKMSPGVWRTECDNADARIIRSSKRGPSKPKGKKYYHKARH